MFYGCFWPFAQKSAFLEFPRWQIAFHVSNWKDLLTYPHIWGWKWKKVTLYRNEGVKESDWLEWERLIVSKSQSVRAYTSWMRKHWETLGEWVRVSERQYKTGFELMKRAMEWIRGREQRRERRQRSSRSSIAIRSRKWDLELETKTLTLEILRASSSGFKRVSSSTRCISSLDSAHESWKRMHNPYTAGCGAWRPIPQ